MDGYGHLSLSFIRFNYSFLCNQMTFENFLLFSELLERGTWHCEYVSMEMSMCVFSSLNRDCSNQIDL